MRHLGTDDVEAVLTIEECIDALVIAYDDLAAGRAASLPHVDVHATTDPAVAFDDTALTEPVGYRLKTQTGVVRSMNVGAIRFNSLLLHWPTVDGRPRSTKLPATADGSFVGYCLLFDSRSGELLSMIPDGYLGRQRVAATNVVVADRLRERRPAVTAVLGAGEQATAHVLAIDAVEQPDVIRVFSPRSRHAFVDRMADQVETPLVAVDDPATACDGAERVYTTTNQLEPVVDRELLDPGAHLSCVHPVEVDATVFDAADRVVFHSLEHLAPVHYTVGEEMATVPELTMGWHPQADRIDLDAVGAEDLADAFGDPVRAPETETTLFVNNVGLGIQFAAIGKRVFDLARERDLGRKLPDEWFRQPYR